MGEGVESEGAVTMPDAPVMQPPAGTPVAERGEEGDDEAGWTAALKSWIGLVVKALFWALVIYQFLFQVSEVKRDSMRPTFEDGDRVLVDKLVLHFRAPRPGEVVVFEAVVRDRHDAAVHYTRQDYIKRVIAGPGDLVRFRDGGVQVNGVPVTGKWEKPTYVSGTDEGNGEYCVPSHHYFVLGDNRSYSEDSRGAILGFVAERQLKGLVRARIWPFKRWEWF